MNIRNELLEELKSTTTELDKKRTLLNTLSLQRRNVHQSIKNLEREAQRIKEKLKTENGELPVPIHVYMKTCENIGKVDMVWEQTITKVEDLKIPTDIAEKMKDNDKYYTSGDAFHEWDDFSAVLSFGPPTKLKERIGKGKVVFVSMNGYWNDTEDFASPIIEDPTYFDAYQMFHESIYTTLDKHHIFLESVSKVEKQEILERVYKKRGRDVTVYSFGTGS